MIDDLTDSGYISSKEILDKAGISRATLNNYIKAGIIPKPVVKRPGKHHKNIKSLGYFPETVLDTLSEVKRLKKEGRSMDSIAMDLGGLPGDIREETVGEDGSAPVCQAPVKTRLLTFSLKGLDEGAYLLNYNFEIVWCNKAAEKDLFHQNISRTDPPESRNIFRLLFQREFHDRVRNRKDLLSFHMSFAKIKFARTWIKRLYHGISDREIHILQSIYDDTKMAHDQPVHESLIDLKNKDGLTDQYNVFSIFFHEGILFMYRRK